ncbi:lysozyme inhibitor LprI family protein [Cupriavidus sp. SK-4]|uniref:lysozyme inhibitor LprI family protein n=1 Tax=Cupriavidus sp. SK-4 TaxID=574750 RepID=UPI001378F4D5|nr:lysozyme inhibitor LprI family protein [Cupriavidus sp. SK-4]
MKGTTAPDAAASCRRYTTRTRSASQAVPLGYMQEIQPFLHTKPMKAILSALTLALLAPVAAQAANECDKYRTSYDKTYCFAKLFLESDKELNGSYNELRGMVGDSVKQKLKDTQLEWIKYRDASCEQGGAIDVDCNYRVNRDRAEYLRDRVRECKAGTCRNDMIAKKAWN